MVCPDSKAILNRRSANHVGHQTDSLLDIIGLSEQRNRVINSFQLCFISSCEKAVVTYLPRTPFCRGKPEELDWPSENSGASRFDQFHVYAVHPN